MKSKQRTYIKLGTASLAVTIAGLAIAGSEYPVPVNMGSDWAGGTSLGARTASDKTQAISCHTWAMNGASTGAGYCWARHSGGAYRQCFATSAEQLAVMRSVGPASYINFSVASNGYHCQSVQVSNGSAYMRY